MDNENYYDSYQYGDTSNKQEEAYDYNGVNFVMYDF